MIETSEMIERIKREGKAALTKQKFIKENIGIYLEKLLSKKNLLPKDAIKEKRDSSHLFNFKKLVI